MLIRFSRGVGLAGAVVRAYTNSRFAHVGFLLEDGYVLDATPQYGVAIRRQSVLPGDALFEVSVSAETMTEAMTWAQAQIGRPYDWRGILGLGLHRDWHDDGQWWCSELVLGAFETTAEPLLHTGFVTRVTPRDLLFSTRLRLLRQIPLSARDGNSLWMPNHPLPARA